MYEAHLDEEPAPSLLPPPRPLKRPEWPFNAYWGRPVWHGSARIRFVSLDNYEHFLVISINLRRKKAIILVQPIKYKNCNISVKLLVLKNSWFD